MTEKAPKVSIGLAVYNGEKYLEQAIDSILAQTFTDFELIISDNASTDRTPEICQKYAAQDARIRYHRNLTNIGGANNENQTFRMSRGEYFRWAAHDDYCAPDLLEKCVEVMDRDRSIVLCYTGVVEVDSEGNCMRITFPSRGLSKKAEERFREVAARGHVCEETYGLIRSEVLRKTPLQLNYTDSDRVLLAELCLYGPFYQIAEPLFYKRYHPGNIYLDWRSRMAWFNPALQGKIVFPNWMQFFDFFVTIRRVPLKPIQKIVCYLYIAGPWFLRNSKRLIKDLLVAVYMLVRSPEWRKQRYLSTNNWSQ